MAYFILQKSYLIFFMSFLPATAVIKIYLAFIPCIVFFSTCFETQYSYFKWSKGGTQQLKIHEQRWFSFKTSQRFFIRLINGETLKLWKANNFVLFAAAATAGGHLIQFTLNLFKPYWKLFIQMTQRLCALGPMKYL